MLIDVYTIILLFFVGLIAGYLCIILALKLPLRKKEYVNACDHCNHKYKWYQLIPLFSYLMSRGRCPYCKNRISVMYVILDFICGLLFSFGYIFYGFSYELIAIIILTLLAVMIYVSDFKYYVILDGPLVISGFLILLIKYLEGGLNQIFVAILSGLFLFIVMILIKMVGNKIFKRESLGGGDIKLAFIIGIVLNYKLGLITLILSSFFALPYALIILYKKILMKCLLVLF